MKRLILLILLVALGYGLYQKYGKDVRVTSWAAEKALDTMKSRLKRAGSADFSPGDVESVFGDLFKKLKEGTLDNDRLKALTKTFQEEVKDAKLDPKEARELMAQLKELSERVVDKVKD